MQGTDAVIAVLSDNVQSVNMDKISAQSCKYYSKAPGIRITTGTIKIMDFAAAVVKLGS